MNQPGQWVDEVHKHKPIKEIILDMDSSDSPTFGKQEGSAYNGHFGYTCYRPLFVFNQFGDIERALLRNGNVYSSDDWQSVLEPVVGRYRDETIIRYFRGDAAFADPNIYCFLETEDYFYAIRLKGNNILYGHIEHLLTRPVGRPPKKPIVQYHSFQYKAAGRADRTELLLAGEKVRKVTKAMNMLDGFGREVLVFCHIEMMSRKQLSQTYGKGVSNMKSAIDRAEQRLVEYLGEGCEGMGVFCAEDVCLCLAELGEVLALEGRGLVTACVLHYAAERGWSYWRLKAWQGYWILN